jgi:NADH:ubiquinone oxidoreductase subunit 6 (subunit J)
MTFAKYIFYFFEFTAAASALGILLSKNVFKSALFLLICLLSLAAVYILAFAEFIAITQILIYAGGILVVIIFGIMLTSKISGKPLHVSNGHIVAGTLSTSLFFVLLVYFIPDDLMLLSTAEINTNGSINTIGINLMTSYALPFEIAGVLLLIALVGAAVTTSFMKSKKM